MASQILIIHSWLSSSTAPLTMQCSAGAPQSTSIPGFNRLNVKVDAPGISFLPPLRHPPLTHRSFRLRSCVPSKLRRLISASATKTNPSGGSDETRNKTAKGPPFLTILAGLLVFLVVCWIVGSFVLWLFSLFVPSK